MRIDEILVESKQLDEGPVGSAVKAVARGAGKVVGGVAKGVGALAGVAGGVKRAFQTGKQAATDVIGGTGQGADAPRSAAPAQQAAPAATSAAPTTQQINKAGPTGTAPANLGDLTGSETLLAEIEFNSPCGTVANGVLTFDTSTALEDDDAENTGTAAWARIVDSDDNIVADCTVSVTGGSGDITLNSVGIVAGGIVRLNSATITAGNG